MRNETPEKIDDEEVEEEETINDILEETEKIMEPPEEPVEEVYEVPKEEEGYVLKYEAPKKPKVPEDLAERYKLDERSIDEHLLIPSSTKKPKLYVGIFTIFGLTFFILTILAVIATNIVLRWDTWINGAAEDNIGDYQILYVYLGIAGCVVCAVVSLVDVLRHRKDR